MLVHAHHFSPKNCCIIRREWYTEPDVFVVIGVTRMYVSLGKQDIVLCVLGSRVFSLMAPLLLCALLADFHGGRAQCVSMYVLDR